MCNILMSYNTLQKYWSIKGRGYQGSSSWRVGGGCSGGANDEGTPPVESKWQQINIWNENLDFLTLNFKAK